MFFNNSKLDLFVEKIIGSPYAEWDGQINFENVDSPFWNKNKSPPETAIIQDKGCNCVGLVNLLFRFCGVDIDGNMGTVDYCNKFVLQPFQSNFIYKKGTLLLRSYRSYDDQGHVGVVWNNNKILQSIRKFGVNLQFDVNDPLFDDYFEFIIERNLPRKERLTRQIG